MKHIKKIITWYLFAMSWVCFFLLLFRYLPEKKLFDLIYPSIKEMDPNTWDNTHMTVIYIAALLLNGIFILSVSMIMERCKN
ncbi:hypothetical protein BTW28_20790 [Citrobacter freundii]|nr:hypothetical protein BTW28_20790 [Citrobacter freundii]